MSTLLRRVPHDNLYKLVEKLNRNASIVLYSSTVLSVLLSIFDHFEILNELKWLLITINTVLIVLYIFFDNRSSYIFTRAEMKRRLDWLDNSFDTNFSGKKSEGYFNQSNLSPGLYKLALNCFESSFHTDYTVSKMFPRVLVKNVVIIIIFIVCAFIGEREIIRQFLEIALPVVLLQQLIKITFFSHRIGRVLDDFKILFTDLKNMDFEKKTPQALKDLLEYETTLSWASIPLDSEIFMKHRQTLAKEWEELKQEYNII